MTLRIGDAVWRGIPGTRALSFLAGLWAALGVQVQPAKAETPWDLRALQATPKWTILERPKIEGVKALTYEGLSYRGKPTRVFAWLGLPSVKAGEKVPAMVLVHGGGGTAFEEWVRLWVSRGYAAIAMDTCGQLPVGHYGRWFRDDQGGPPGWGGFDQVAQPREDQWTYHAVADIILAHSLIRSLPEVDPERTGITGISWGGYLTCLVAGIDRRFKLAVPVYGCGFYRDTVFENNLSPLGPEAATRWMELWDPSVYLPNAEMPILWVNGSNDFAYTMDAMQRSYRLPKSPRTLCVRLRMPHGHGGAGENPEEIGVFADSLLKNGAPLARITGSALKRNQAWAAFASSVPVVKAELNFTRDSGRWQDRQWDTVPAECSEGQISAQLPAGTRVYYFNLFDNRGCVVSTEHAIVESVSFQNLVTQSACWVLDSNGNRLGDSVILTRRWEGDICHAILENRGTQAVNIGSVVLSEFAHGLSSETPVYGEGFTMLSQTGGTLGKPVDEGFFTDRDHYKIPEPDGRRTVYGVITLRAAPGRCVLMGFTGARRFVGRFGFDSKTLSISCDGEGLVLPAGAKWELEPLLVIEGLDHNALFERLAGELNRNHPPICRPPVATGWCSWYCFGPGVTAAQIRGNLAWAKQNFPGLRYIQIDDGYQPWMGDWLETGRSFGGNVSAVLRDIRAEGFEPAIWVAPFVASPQSRLFEEHPDWFVKDKEGQPLRSDRVGFGGWRLGPWYVLDGTHPEAQRWLENLFRTMRSDWGCTYFKLDANYWGALHGGTHHDRSATRVEAYRRGMESIRRGAGDAFILGCNHPLWPSLGLIHGSRSSMDVSRDWHHFAKTGRENLLRGWQNGRLWWNDPDALCLNGSVLAEVPDAAGVTKSIGKASEDEFLFHATLVYATGGMLLAGDDLRTYGEREKKRLEILYPPTGQAMRFANENFDVGRLRLPGNEMIAVLNWQDVARDFMIPLTGRVRVSELWSGQDLGLREGSLELPAIPPHSGRLLRLTPTREDGQ
ncbi:MAG TPA: acetylxylan esterase [Verrucomicrobiota bacterium]|nr:acetylxylan esterase [Verrucomicrobiota bacterium]